MLDTLAAMRRDLAGGEQAVLDLRALVEKLPHDFEASWLVEEGVASFCVSNVS
jgi:hypothetical protein